MSVTDVEVVDIVSVTDVEVVDIMSVTEVEVVVLVLLFDAEAVTELTGAVNETNGHCLKDNHKSKISSRRRSMIYDLVTTRVLEDFNIRSRNAVSVEGEEEKTASLSF
jgi:hypothetical protein